MWNRTRANSGAHWLPGQSEINNKKVLTQKRVLTVLESSLPDSMMRKHKGIISVVNKKFITSCSSVFTKAP